MLWCIAAGSLSYIVLSVPCLATSLVPFFGTVHTKPHGVSVVKAPGTVKLENLANVMRQIGEICPALYTNAFTSFALRTIEQGVLAFLGTIAFVPPHVVETSAVFHSPVPRLPSRLSSRCFPSSWPDTAPPLSLVATEKPFTRWRPALAQDAARGISGGRRNASPNCGGLRRFSVQGLLTRASCFFAEPVLHTSYHLVCQPFCIFLGRRSCIRDTLGYAQK